MAPLALMAQSTLPPSVNPPSAPFGAAVAQSSDSALPRRDGPSADRALSRAAERARLLQAAEEDRAFYTNNPDHPDAKVTRRHEAKRRLLAGLLGADELAPEVLTLAKEVRKDMRFSSEERFEVAVLEERAIARGKRFKDRDEWLRDREESARRLIAEFGDVPASYGHLLQVAQVRSGPHGVALAQQLIDCPAPEAVKALAHDLVQRQTLSGRTLLDVIGGQPGAGSLLKAAAGRPVVLYTWAPEDGAGIGRIKALAAALPAGALVLGINLSRDVPTAVALAAREKLPGEQLYGARAHDSPVVRRLALTVPGLVYAIGGDGVITNLSDLPDRAAALAQLK